MGKLQALLVVCAACGGSSDSGVDAIDPLTTPHSETTCNSSPPETSAYTGSYAVSWRCVGLGPNFTACPPSENPLLSATTMVIGPGMQSGPDVAYRVMLGSLDESARDYGGANRIEFDENPDGTQLREVGYIEPCRTQQLRAWFRWQTTDGTSVVTWSADAVEM